MSDKIPTLTLEPFEEDPKDEKKSEEPAIIEEGKVESVARELLNLTPEEKKMVEDFAEKIDISNSQMVLQYGAASQKKIGNFSEAALDKVRTKDLGETGDMIASLVSELKGFDATEESKGIFGFFKKTALSIEALKNK